MFTDTPRSNNSSTLDDSYLASVASLAAAAKSMSSSRKPSVADMTSESLLTTQKPAARNTESAAVLLPTRYLCGQQTEHSRHQLQHRGHVVFEHTDCSSRGHDVGLHKRCLLVQHCVRERYSHGKRHFAAGDSHHCRRHYPDPKHLEGEKYRVFEDEG